MNEPICKYMKVGLILPMAYPETIANEGMLPETVRKIASDPYFEAVELSYIQDAGIRGKVRKILDTSGMIAVFGIQSRLLATGLNLNDPDAEKRRSAVDLCKAGIDQACELGAEKFLFMSGKYAEDKKDEALDALVESTKEISRYANLHGMQAILETFDYNIDKKCLIGPAKLAMRYAESVRAECGNFGLAVDLSHIPLIGETAEQAILPVKGYLLHAHLGNCVMKDPSLPAYGDLHPRFGFPNGENGAEQIAEFLEVLSRIGFLNAENPPVVSFEVKPYGDEEPDLVVANAKRALNLAWCMV